VKADMRQTNLKDFDKHLEEVGVIRGRNLVVHARLVSFGRCIADDAVAAIRNRIGPQAS
jgi:aminoglycoside N3'-acetyltransferase